MHPWSDLLVILFLQVGIKALHRSKFTTRKVFWSRAGTLRETLSFLSCNVPLVWKSINCRCLVLQHLLHLRSCARKQFRPHVLVVTIQDYLFVLSGAPAPCCSVPALSPACAINACSRLIYYQLVSILLTRSREDVALLFCSGIQKKPKP